MPSRPSFELMIYSFSWGICTSGGQRCQSTWFRWTTQSVEPFSIHAKCRVEGLVQWIRIKCLPPFVTYNMLMNFLCERSTIQIICSVVRRSDSNNRRSLLVVVRFINVVMKFWNHDGNERNPLLFCAYIWRYAESVFVFLSIFAAKQREVSKKTPRLKNKLKTSF